MSDFPNYEAADDAAMAVWRSDDFLRSSISGDYVRQIGRAAVEAAPGDEPIYREATLRDINESVKVDYLAVVQVWPKKGEQI